DAARVTELQRAPHVHRVEQILDRHAVRVAVAQQLAQAPMDVLQFFGKRCGRRGADRAAGHDAVAGAVGFDAAVAGTIGAGVDTENSHASEASISFSEMSKFPDTFCTSS